MADMAMLKRKKRGSLQQKDRHAILRDGTERLFSVPSFLELGASSASNGGSESAPRPPLSSRSPPSSHFTPFFPPPTPQLRENVFVGYFNGQSKITTLTCSFFLSLFSLYTHQTISEVLLSSSEHVDTDLGFAPVRASSPNFLKKVLKTIGFIPLTAIPPANLDGLVELLTADDADSDYVETFVATHTYFVDSQSLMTRLMERFYDGEVGTTSFFLFMKISDRYLDICIFTHDVVLCRRPKCWAFSRYG